MISSADIKIEIQVADVLKCGADVIVLSANPSLLAGGGLSGAIHRAAGPELETYSKGLAPLSPGTAVVTRFFNLNARYIIHAVCPRYFSGLDKECDLLTQNYRAALNLYDQCSDTKSIAFALMGTGVYRWPLSIAAKIALQELVTSTFDNTLMFLADEQSRLIYQRARDEMLF